MVPQREGGKGAGDGTTVYPFLVRGLLGRVSLATPAPSGEPVEGGGALHFLYESRAPSLSPSTPLATASCHDNGSSVSQYCPPPTPPANIQDVAMGQRLGPVSPLPSTSPAGTNPVHYSWIHLKSPFMKEMDDSSPFVLVLGKHMVPSFIPVRFLYFLEFLSPASPLFPHYRI